MNTTYQQIVDARQIASRGSNEDLNKIIALAQAENSKPAAQDEKRSLLLAIDIQNDFMEDIGSLAVPGSRGDVMRLTKWMYNNMEGLTQVMCSLDCHSVEQIFHASWWVDGEGNNPAPFTLISQKDVESGRWRAVNGETERSMEYLRNLELGDKKQLCIWPYHCLEGTFGAKLESEFTKMLYFHATARGCAPQMVYKGQNPYTEMYGIIKAEYDTDGFVNQAVLDAVAQYDTIYVAGEASSHCVLASLEQILDHYKDNRAVTSRITLLEDCMSPIAGFGNSTAERFIQFQEKYGIQISKSTDVIV